MIINLEKALTTARETQNIIQVLSGSGVGYNLYDERINYATYNVPNLLCLLRNINSIKKQKSKNIFSDIKQINKSYINYDMFLDPSINMSFDFKTGKIVDTNRPNILILSDPYGDKNNFNLMNNRKDLASIISIMFGVCPKRNPLLKRLIGLEIAKNLNNQGYNVNKKDNSVYLTTSGFFDNIIKKISRSIKSSGKKIEKEILKPIRETLKQNAPEVWEFIDKTDRSLGITNTLKKHSKEIDKISRKYGGMVIEKVITMAAAAYGGPAGSMAASALISVANNLSEKEKKSLSDVVEKEGNINNIDRYELKNTMSSLFSKIKEGMYKEGGNQGLEDFQRLLDISKDIQSKAVIKSKELSGLKADVTPLYGSSWPYLGAFLSIF